MISIQVGCRIMIASWVPCYDLDSFRGHLLIGANIFSLVERLTWDSLHARLNCESLCKDLQEEIYV